MTSLQTLSYLSSLSIEWITLSKRCNFTRDDPSPNVKCLKSEVSEGVFDCDSRAICCLKETGLLDWLDEANLAKILARHPKRDAAVKYSHSLSKECLMPVRMPFTAILDF